MKRKTTLLFLASFFVLSFILLLPITLAAKNKPYMKSAKVRWNLKPDKTITFKTYYSGYGYIDAKATVKDYEVTKADENGLKTINFLIDYKFPKLKLTKKQAQKILDAGNRFTFLWTVLDYNTGKCLELKNDLGVTVEQGEWEHSDDYYEFPTAKNDKIWYGKSVKKAVTITYPENFDRLCLMIGGSLDPFYDGSDFWDGDLPLKKTKFYKKDNNKLSSFMRMK